MAFSYFTEERIDIFLHIYMYELEKALKESKQDLKKISFHSDEANVDRPLKEFLKSFIMTKITTIPRDKYENQLKMVYINEAGKEQVQTYHYSDYFDISIIEVLLPEEISDYHKEVISETKTSVYTNPDLLFVLEDGKKEKYTRSIELKSTQTDSIPGSSVQQVNPMEWVIFFRHNKDDISIMTGQYVNTINSKLQFPDRSPRPQVSFAELYKWNEKNRNVSQRELKYVVSHDDSNIKLTLLSDWQNFLADRWLTVLRANETKTNEPWFNNALRKFIVKFVEDYDMLSPHQKTDYVDNIKRLIRD